MNPPLIHPQAVYSREAVGKDVAIGAFSVLAEGVRLGDGVVVGSSVIIGKDVSIGEESVICDGAILAPGMEIRSRCHVGPGVTFASQRVGGGAMGARDSRTLVGSHCVIGANATICAGVRIGDHAIIDAGAVLTQDAHPHTIMAGNPAKAVGFCGTDADTGHQPAERSGGIIRDSRVPGVKSYTLPFFSDPRGNLTVGEFGKLLPFHPKRFFLTFDVPGAHLRGEHAHKECDQFLVCVQGACAVVVDDGIHREEFQLNHPTTGILVPRMIWAIEYKHTADSVLLVFASEHYDPDDYIREYDAFLALASRGGPS